MSLNQSPPKNPYDPSANYRTYANSQSQIARMESGSYMPSVNSIYKYAQAVQQVIHVSFIP